MLYEINPDILNTIGEYLLALKTKMEETPVEDIYKTYINEFDTKEDAYDAISKMILNYNSDAVALKAEEARLAERRKNIENKSAELLDLLNAKFGKKEKFSVATLSYRKSESLEVTDAKATTDWLIAHEITDCVKFIDPEVRKTETKNFIKTTRSTMENPDEFEIPGCKIVEKNNYSLK